MNLVNQLVNPPVSQSINRSINQSINQAGTARAYNLHMGALIGQY